MKYGPIKEVLLLGGGRLLRNTVLWALKKKIPLKVVTSPRHSRDKVENVSLEQFLISKKIKFKICEKMDKDFEKFVGDTRFTFCLSIGAAWILNPKIIKEIFENKLFNIHGTRLPEGRGGGGFSWQIMMKNRLGFSTLHILKSGIDEGEIVDYFEFLYPHSCRKPIDYKIIQDTYSLKLIESFVERKIDKSEILNLKNQQEYFSSYWPRLNTEMNGWINWNLNDDDIDCFICAFDDPYDGAKTFLNDKIFHLKSVMLTYENGKFHPFQKGIIYRKNKKWISVCLKNSTLLVEKVLNKNGENCIEDLKVGDRFYTPSSNIDISLKRSYYDSVGVKKIK